jgi:hypothetical protein
MSELIAQEDEAFSGDWESEAAFAEDFMESTGSVDSEALQWLVVDWAATYNYSLSHDYFFYDVVDVDGSFHKFFWNANV